jgi:hypothetical protein
MNNEIRTSMLMLAVGLVMATLSFSRDNPVKPDLAALAAGMTGKVSNRALSALEREGQPGIRFDERSGDGLAWWPEIKFSDGTIEFDVRGKDAFQQSFVGVAFHGLDETTYDAVYFRPFNFHSSDPVRRNHAVQYVAQPLYTWQKLRSEHPEKYEKPVASAPDPNGWFHVRIVVAHPKVSVFVNDAAEPSLVVEQLSARKTGWVGFWTGNGSGGEFANLKVSSQ